MTSKSLENLEALIALVVNNACAAHGFKAMGYDDQAATYEQRSADHRAALVKLVDDYGAAQRREGRRDVAGRSPKQKTSRENRRQ